jgi:hypothetical protein
MKAAVADLNVQRPNNDVGSMRQKIVNFGDVFVPETSIA